MHTPSGGTYRLYIDESGDPVYTNGQEPSMQYLALMGVWFRRPRPYLDFFINLEKLKLDVFGPSPTGKPVILHRKDIMQRRGVFGALNRPEKAKQFDEGLLRVVSDADFRMTCVVIDKLHHQTLHPTPMHPYHYCMDAMLQRYCAWLDTHQGTGDVAAETRGANEDEELKDAYSASYHGGLPSHPAAKVQKTLSSSALTTCIKEENVAGLQLADILANPARIFCLAASGIIAPQPPCFGTRLIEACREKFNCHSSTGQIEEYGTVWLSQSPLKPESPHPSMTRKKSI